jgi:hypothetical protein
VTSPDHERAADVGSDVTDWISSVEHLLCRLQVAIEMLQHDAAIMPEARDMLEELRAQIRELRADTPHPHHVRTWLRALATTAVGTSRLRGPARFINVATDPREPQTDA